jgi:hypothetical protein
MRMFIRDAYEKWGIEWVLLGGDTNVLPARYGVNTYYPPQGFTEIPVDMYFSCLDGNWNADGDYVFGEAGDDCDMADEVMLGRAPVSDEAAATVFVDKVISYERTVAGDAWTNRVLFAAEMLFPQIWQQGMPITLDGAIFAEELVDSLIVPCTDMAYTRMYENHWDYTGSVPLTRETFIDTVNTGRYGICNQTGHGFFFNMSVGDANFTNADADALVNENPFLIYALNCASAAFDKACLMERLLQNPNGGSVVSIGSSRAAFPYTTHRYQMRFFRHLYCLSANQPGELIFLSKMPQLGSTHWEGADRWTFMVYTLLGDPALRIWTGSPEAAQVSAPATLSTGQQNVTITVTSGGAPVDSALVCLTKTGEDYAYDWTDPTGQVSLPFTPTSGGDAVLTVTGTDLEFTLSSIPVTPTSTYVAVVEISFIDDYRR